MSRPKWQRAYNRRGYEQDGLSRRGKEAQTWTSAQPAGPVRRVSPEEIARMERVRADKRLEKEFRAYDKLEEINRRWEQKGGGSQ